MLQLILKSNMASFLSTRLLIRLSNKRVILPFYHTIHNINLPFIKHIYTVKTVKNFKTDLEFLLKHFEPIHPNQIEDIKTKKNSGKNYMLLTFDDGLKGNYDLVLPILKKLSIPAIFFVNSAFIDNKDLFYRYKESLIIDYFLKHSLTATQQNKINEILANNKFKTNNIKRSILSINFSNRNLLDNIAQIIDLDFNNFLQEEKPYLTSSQIKQILESNYVVGSHSINHPLYHQLNIEDQIKQTKESLLFLRNNFNIKEYYFSFPFTDYNINATFFNEIYNDLHVPVKYSFGSAGLKNEQLQNHFQRIPIEKGNYTAQQIIKSEYIYYLFKSIIGKNTIIRK